MSDRLRGAVVLLTGGAGGVGYAVARRLVAAGARVVLWDVDVDGLSRVAEELGRDAIRTDVVDLTDSQAVLDAVARVRSVWGPPDMLINNAGVLVPGDFHERHISDWQRTVDVNLTAQLCVTHAVLPEMYRRGTGHIVNVCSAASFVGVAGLAAYSATKWALWGFSEALRHEARNLGVSVHISSVHPMYIARGLFAGARIRGPGGCIFPRVPHHDVIARAIVESALRRRRRVVCRPRSLHLVPFLRGVSTDRAFAWLGRVLQVNRSMDSWHGSNG